jgi:glutamine synthetase
VTGPTATHARDVESAIATALANAGRAGVGRVSFGCFDWNGRLRATQHPVDALAHALRDGLPLTSAIFATDTAERPILTGHFHDPANGYRDAWLQPDPRAVLPDPYTDGAPGLLVLGELRGEFASCCPRAILRRELDALARLGFGCRAAFELEYHVLLETPASLRAKIPAALERHPALERMYSYVDQALAAPLFDATRAAAAACGIPVRSLHAEFSGLLEVALGVSDGLAAADHAGLFKALAKIVARRHGALATFMAQLAAPFESAGGHLNVSLRSLADDRPVFHAPDGACDPALRAFIGGLQRHTPALLLLHLPHLNSYKRFRGDSFAPRTNSWGFDNKTCASRIVTANPELARIEFRLPGADLNPHLALAAVVAAGRRGIELGLAPSAPVSGDAAAPGAPQGAALPLDFATAIAAWRESAFARATFGDLFVDAYALSREWEIDQLARTVTDWELRQFGEGV